MPQGRIQDNCPQSTPPSVGLRWVVFDNAEDLRDLAPVLPEGPGQVLIMSRNPWWRSVASAVRVAEHPHESIALLLLLLRWCRGFARPERIRRGGGG